MNGKSKGNLHRTPREPKESYNYLGCTGPSKIILYSPTAKGRDISH